MEGGLIDLVDEVMEAQDGALIAFWRDQSSKLSRPCLLSRRWSMRLCATFLTEQRLNPSTARPSDNQPPPTSLAEYWDLPRILHGVTSHGHSTKGEAGRIASKPDIAPAALFQSFPAVHQAFVVGNQENKPYKSNITRETAVSQETVASWESERQENPPANSASPRILKTPFLSTGVQ